MLSLLCTQVISKKEGDSSSLQLQASGESRAGQHLCSILRWYRERVCWSLAGREAGHAEHERALYGLKLSLHGRVIAGLFQTLGLIPAPWRDGRGDRKGSLIQQFSRSDDDDEFCTLPPPKKKLCVVVTPRAPHSRIGSAGSLQEPAGRSRSCSAVGKSSAVREPRV